MADPGDLNAEPNWPFFVKALALAKILEEGALTKEETSARGCAMDGAKKYQEKKIQRVAVYIVEYQAMTEVGRGNVKGGDEF